jgi:hypothetical protein
MAEFCHFENLMVLPTSFNKGAELKPFAPPNRIFARSGLVLRQIRSNGWIYALTYSAFQKPAKNPCFWSDLPATARVKTAEFRHSQIFMVLPTSFNSGPKMAAAYPSS